MHRKKQHKKQRKASQLIQSAFIHLDSDFSIKEALVVDNEEKCI